MSRTQKKCFIASSAIHGLLLLILMIGPAFFLSKQDTEELPTIEFINLDNVVVTDARVFSGGSPEIPRQQRQEPPRIERPAEPPRPAVREREPVRAEPDPPRRNPEPGSETPQPAPVRHKPKINTTMIIRRDESQPRRASQANPAATQVASAVSDIKQKLSSTTTIDFKGPGGAAMVNYAQLVRSKYEQSWIAPADTDKDNAVVKVTVTIARSGNVISARIIGPSGDASVDRSVRQTLDRVKFIARFPEGVREEERTFIINFNLKAKLLG